MFYCGLRESEKNQSIRREIIQYRIAIIFEKISPDKNKSPDENCSINLIKNLKVIIEKNSPTQQNCEATTMTTATTTSQPAIPSGTILNQNLSTLTEKKVNNKMKASYSFNNRLRQ